MATMRTMTVATVPPPMMAAMLEDPRELVEDDGLSSVAGERHSPSLRDVMATVQCESTVISTPVTMILAPPLTQSSIREMREPLSVSGVSFKGVGRQFKV